MRLLIQAMRLHLLYSAFVFVLVLITLSVCSQTLSSYGNPSSGESTVKTGSKGGIAGTWEAGAMFGPDFYYGDLNSSKFLPRGSISVAGGGYIMRQFTNVVGLKGQLLVGGVHGAMNVEEIYGPVFYSFNGFFIDFSANAVINLSNMFSPYHSGRKLFVYATAGLGVNAWNTKMSATFNGVTSDTAWPAGMKAALVIPFGLGLQYAITKKISVGAEYTVRTVLSDQVDHYAKGFKADFINLFAVSVSFRFGTPRKNLAVQEYAFPNQVRYQPSSPAPIQAPPVQEVASVSEVYDYVVQIAAFSKHNYSVTWVKKHYRVDMPVIKESENGLNRYIIGRYYKDLTEAKELCNRLRKQGITDAWVIAYKNGQRDHVVVY